MAHLRNIQTNNKLYLLNHHTFGRRREMVDTFISQLEISNIHAVVKWTGEHWYICDLGRNGTWLDNQKLPTGKNTPLKKGQTITFANQSQHKWIVESINEPQNLLLGLNENSTTKILEPYHLIPDENTPMAALYLCQKRKQWVLDKYNTTTSNYDDNNEKILSTNDTIEFGQYQWQVILNQEQQQTIDLTNNETNVSYCNFLFNVSLDEEHTELSLQYQDKKIALGERSHHYLLLYLTRVKNEHANKGIDEHNQGWITNEQLAKDLGIDITHINIQIFRARKQIVEALPNILGITDLLQRRRGETRFNCPQAKITKGKNIEVLCI